MTATFARHIALCGLVTSAALVAGCGDVSQGQAPAQVIVQSLLGTSGNGTLQSDVITKGSISNDFAVVSMRLRSKDPGAPGIAAVPSFLNSVTINRYHVQYVRTDGRNSPGIEVPYAFDSAVTFTISSDAVAEATFQIVRHTAKEEAPLKALAVNNDIISTIAQVTFYGRDQAGNDVVVSAQMGIDFGNFADPS